MVSRNFAFRSADACQPLFEAFLRHNQLLWSLETVRSLFALNRAPRCPTSGQITIGLPMECFKIFYRSNWLKCYDKFGVILRFELVVNAVMDSMANKSLSDLRHLIHLGRQVCRRLDRASLASVSSPVGGRPFDIGVD